MAIRNLKLGGTDLGDEAGKPSDWNDTFDVVVERFGLGIAQNAYRTLQANDVFENKDFLATDEFVDSTGTNNTVNTGTSTATYDTINNTYRLSFTDEASGDTTHDPDSFTSPGNAFDNNDSTTATKSDNITSNWPHVLGKTFSSKYVGFCKYKVLKDPDGSATLGATIETYNGSTWTNVYTIFANDGTAQEETRTILIDDTIQGIRVSFPAGGADNAKDATVYTLEYGDFDASSTVVCDSNILTLDGTEEAITVYCDITNTANTNVTVDLSDGTTTLSAKAINETHDITTLTASSDLQLTFNLSTTDDTESPSLKGYAVLVK